MEQKNWVMDAILAVFGPLISAWLADVHWTFPITAVIFLLAVSVFLGIRLFRLSRSRGGKVNSGELDVLGLVIDQERKSVGEVARDCTSSFYFLGISGGRTVKNPELLSMLGELARNGGDVRFLLLDPDCKDISRRALDEGASSNDWVHDINATIGRLKGATKDHNSSIKIKLYSSYPVWRMVIADRRSIHLNYFLYNRQFTQSPQVVLLKTDLGMLNPFQKVFDELWDNAKDA